MGTSGRNIDQTLAHRLAVYYAPELRFDSREKYFPCSIDWLASHSELWCKTTFDQRPCVVGAKQTKVGRNNKQWIMDKCIAGVGETSSSDPHAASATNCPLGQGSIQHEHRLRPLKEKWVGSSREELEEKALVPCYFSVVPAARHIFDDIVSAEEDHCEDVFEITYYMIYAYNGNIFNICGLGSPFEVGVHEGDLEQVVVYARDPDTLERGEDGLLAVFMHRHSGEGRFCEPESDLDFSEGEHFIVYPACESHASYSRPSWTCRICGFASDLHNGKGRRWQTWDNLQIVDKSSETPKWIAFDGKYGDTDGLQQRSNLGRPGFPSRSCSLPALIPDRSFRGSLEGAKRQIPKRLLRATSEPKKATLAQEIVQEIELPLI